MARSSSQCPNSTHAPSSNAARGRLGDERGLAQTGLARDEQHLASLAGGDPLDRVRHRRRSRLRGRPHPTAGRTARRPGSGTRVRRSSAERFPAHLDGLHRIGQALQRQRPDRAACVAAAPTGHGPHHVRGEDLAALARRAQPGRLDHRVAEVVVVLAGDLAAAQPDPQADRLLAARGCRVRRPAASPPRTTARPTRTRTPPSARHPGSSPRCRPPRRSPGAGSRSASRRTSSAASGDRLDANAVEPTMSVNSTVTFSVVIGASSPPARLYRTRTTRSARRARRSRRAGGGTR